MYQCKCKKNDDFHTVPDDRAATNAVYTFMLQIAKQVEWVDKLGIFL